MGGMIPTHVRATAGALPADVPRQCRSSTGSEFFLLLHNHIYFTCWAMNVEHHPPRVRSRSRSRRRDTTLAFPCPDCKTRSFASEAGLYAHRFLLLREGKVLSIVQDPDLRITGQGEADKSGLQVHILPKGIHHAYWGRIAQVSIMAEDLNTSKVDAFFQEVLPRTGARIRRRG